MIGFTEILYKKVQKKILVIFILVCGIMQTVFISILFTDISLIGRQVGLFYSEYTLFTRLYILSILLTFFITGVIFAIKSMKIENPELKLKGKFLLFAFIFYTLGTILETQIPLTILTVVILRLIMIFSVFEFYFGFILPEPIKNMFIKGDINK